MLWLFFYIPFSVSANLNEKDPDLEYLPPPLGKSILTDQPDIFEYGIPGVGNLVFHAKGTIGSRQADKHTQIRIKVPNCYLLMYTRVEVTNIFGPPLVNFDLVTQTVNIKYRPDQYSISAYEIFGYADASECTHEENTAYKEAVTHVAKWRKIGLSEEKTPQKLKIVKSVLSYKK